MLFFGPHYTKQIDHQKLDTLSTVEISFFFFSLSDFELKIKSCFTLIQFHFPFLLPLPLVSLQVDCGVSDLGVLRVLVLNFWWHLQWGRGWSSSKRHFNYFEFKDVSWKTRIHGEGSEPWIKIKRIKHNKNFTPGGFSIFTVFSGRCIKPVGSRFIFAPRETSFCWFWNFYRCGRGRTVSRDTLTRPPYRYFGWD